MPTGELQSVSIFPGQINVPCAGFYISMSVQSDGSAESMANLEPYLQELIDLVQTWPRRTGNVTGQLYGSTLATMTPTNADPDDTPPPDEPPAGEAVTEEPAPAV
jgi:hypothetical protein